MVMVKGGDGAVVLWLPRLWSTWSVMACGRCRSVTVCRHGRASGGETMAAVDGVVIPLSPSCWSSNERKWDDDDEGRSRWFGLKERRAKELRMR
ncbi:hypothetical protein Dimus_035882, partial [Dionaea muscipula]